MKTNYIVQIKKIKSKGKNDRNLLVRNGIILF